MTHPGGNRGRIGRVRPFLVAIAMGAIAGCSDTNPTDPGLPGGLDADPTALGQLVDDTHGAVTGVVFSDLDQDGIRDEGEPGLAGFVVDLAYPTGFTESVWSGADGSYVFDNLAPAFYIVSAPGAAPWTRTTRDNVSVRVIAAEFSTVDHGFYSEPTGPTTGTAAGTVFDDVDRDGVQDTGEGGIAGLPVTATDAGGTTVQATTDVDGHFNFEDLEVGSYMVTGPELPGWDSTTPSSTSVEVVAGEEAAVRFGLAQVVVPSEFAAIGGSVFADLDGDGRRGANEPGIGGVTVCLSSRNQPRGADAELDSGIHRYAVSQDDGSWSFADIEPGDWRVSVGPLAASARTTSRSADYRLVAGEVVAGPDFGFATK